MQRPLLLTPGDRAAWSTSRSLICSVIAVFLSWAVGELRGMLDRARSLGRRASGLDPRADLVRAIPDSPTDSDDRQLTAAGQFVDAVFRVIPLLGEFRCGEQRQ